MHFCCLIMNCPIYTISLLITYILTNIFPKFIYFTDTFISNIIYRQDGDRFDRNMISKSQKINSTSGPRVLLSLVSSVRPPVHAIFFTALQPTVFNRFWWYMVPQMNLLGWSLLLMGSPCSFLRILLHYILWIHTDRCLISGSLSLYHPQYFTGHVWYSYWPQVEHDIC